MIPTMIVIGLLAGLIPRPWYLVGIAAASIAWPVLLVATDTISAGDPVDVVGALLLALANVIVGVGVTRGTAKVVRTLAHHS